MVMFMHILNVAGDKKNRSTGVTDSLRFDHEIF